MFKLFSSLATGAGAGLLATALLAGVAFAFTGDMAMLDTSNWAIYAQVAAVPVVFITSMVAFFANWCDMEQTVHIVDQSSYHDTLLIEELQETVSALNAKLADRDNLLSMWGIRESSYRCRHSTL